MSDDDPAGAGESGAEGGGRSSVDPPGLKDRLGYADDTDVQEGLAGLPRLTWDAVTDAGGAPVDAGPDTAAGSSNGDSSFQFDLGGALARLAGDDEPAPPPSAPEAEPPPAAPPMTTSPTVRADSPTPSAAAPPPPPPAPPAVEPPVQRDPMSFETPTPSPPPPPAPAPSPTTRPIEPMTYQPIVSEPPPAAAPPVAAPPSAPTPADSQQPSEYPRRVPGTHLESQMRSQPATMPEIREATPSDAPPSHPGRISVFDDVQGGAAPTLPSTAATLPSAAPTLPASTPAAAPTMPAARPSPAPGGAAMPILPASNPAAPAPVAESPSASVTTPDITALRSAQLRANKQQRQGKMLGRSLLAFVVIAGLIAGALVFGRSLLFDTEWDAQLTPIVNEIEAERGSFDHAVPIVRVPAAEFGQRLLDATIGDEWVERVPEWRALGIAAGSSDASSVGAALAASTTAVYDPIGDQIVQLEGIDPSDGAADLRRALERAFVAQSDVGIEAADDVDDGETVDADTDTDTGDTGATESTSTDGLVGVSSLETIAVRAADEALVSGASVGFVDGADSNLPLPIAYEFAAVDALGDSILGAIGLDPATSAAGAPYPDSIATVLDDDPTSAAAALIQPGDVALTTPRSLGTDDWSLVWGARLPAPTVDLLVDRVTADSYRTVRRNGATCFVAVFGTADELAGNSVFASLLTWAANAPAASGAVAGQIDPTRVQLEACDPGVEGSTLPNTGVVESLIARQQQRLTN